MNLDTFLHNLHFDIEKIMPPNQEVNWEDAPLPYKLYRGLSVTPLSLEVPLTVDGQSDHTEPTLEKMGHFLWYVFGLTQFYQPAVSLDPMKRENMYRRFVPSGGALYPNELYLYVKLKNFPHGIYHYDAAHHRFVLLREGNFDSYVTEALGHRCDVSNCFGIAFVSTMFHKNFFKYHNFSYRLQGLDAGVLIGQFLEVTKRFHFTSGVYFQFLDRAINHLLGLSEQEESVYAVMPLSTQSLSELFTKNETREKNIHSHTLIEQLPLVQHTHYVRSQEVSRHPMVTKMNEAAMLEETNAFPKTSAEADTPFGMHTIVLPRTKRLSYDFAAICQERHSPDLDFVWKKTNRTQLATLLQETVLSFSYQNDLDAAHSNPKSRVSLCGCLYNVDGIPDGAYYYDSNAHSLVRIQFGDFRYHLQAGMSMDNVNLFQVPLCLHVVGNKDFYKGALGYRGYRIQQMEAGMLVQKLVLAASAIGMGGHPLLGFNAKLCDQLYKMDATEKTTLIQIPVGSYRPRAWLKGALHS